MDDSIDQFRYRSGVETEKSSIKEKEKVDSEEGVDTLDEVDDHDVYVAFFFG
jgi:hypothetical protein